MFHPLHHLHIRKRIHERHELYPHPRLFVRVVDFLIYTGCIIGPLVALPQLMQIWVYKNAAGISIFTWVGYCVLTFLWLVYGIIHKEKAIILSQSTWLIFNIAITLGAILYQ